MKTVQNAKGLQGCILWNNDTNHHFFRVYAEDKSFTDYAIHAEDVFVKITSEDLSLVEADGSCGCRNRLEYEHIGHKCFVQPTFVAEDDVAAKMEAAYREGYEDAVSNYAIWKDGRRVVGCMEEPLSSVLEKFQKGKIPVRY